MMVWISQVLGRELSKYLTLWIIRPQKKCYAWSYETDDAGKRKFVAGLHQDPINSPQNAVKAAIVLVGKND
jgi:hypothetical protein